MSQGPLDQWEALGPPRAVTVGVFDGVHHGHRMILGRLVAAPFPSTVLTFDPHPAEVLSPGTNPRLITTVEERIELMQGLGVDSVGVLDLSEIRNLEPEQFVSQVLVAKLGVRLIVVGSDFQFGRDRAGDSGFLRRAGETHGFDVDVVDLVESGRVISSTRVRRLIEEGEVSTAATLLGSRYRLSNVVVPGDRRGKTLGFPTANLEPPARKVIPGNGIYAAFAHVGAETLAAAVSVGVRPTFGGTETLIEAFILDFDRDIYGSVLGLEFVERLRPELEFDNPEALIGAMNQDVARVRQVLESAPLVG
ncbi:MAG TPA: bifunctional riboflavin kinase/FAD synthetase [Acidimicrobiia bacterium]|nr:bifunctional riboflavin kinase/FAD synthetase [Acidimicrobiia bacterium]